MHEHINTTPGRLQHQSAAERLFNLFVGNERRHIRNTGPPVLDTEKKKWSLKSTTHEGPATLEHWQEHLDQKNILSVIPLLDNGTCWFACIDVDEYDLSHLEICDHIKTQKFPLLPFVSKSGGLHLFAFFKEPVPAELVIPALRSMATRLGLNKYEVFPTSVGENKLTRAVAMPYGARWDVLPDQALITGHGNRQLLEECFVWLDRARITPAELPKPQESKQQSRQLPLYMQGAIAAIVSEKDRSNYCWSIFQQLINLGFDQDQIIEAVRDRGAFIRYSENNRSLEADVARAFEKYNKENPNKKTKVKPCTDIVPWDPAPPPPVEFSVHKLIATGTITLLLGDSGTGKSFVLWNYAVCRMFASPFADHKVTKPCGVMVWLSEGAADYRQRCRAALKTAGLDPNQPLPLVAVNDKMIALTQDQAEEQLHGMIDNAEAWLREHFGFGLGCIIIDTFDQAALFKDGYKPYEIIDVNQKLRRIACSRLIDVIYTVHFPKEDKNHPAGTLQKRNDADQILVLTSNRMMLDKSRYSADKIWNAFQRRPADDGAGNPTLAIEFGPTQYPAQHEVDNAEVFATALQDAQQDFGMRIRETDLQRLFIDLHVAAQVKSGIKSKNPKEQARSAFRRQLKDAQGCGLVGVKEGFVEEIKHGF